MNYSERLCLSLLQNCKSLRQIKQIQAFTCKSGLESHPLIAGKLILHSAVSIPVSLDYARRLLLFHVPEPDVFMYNSVIRGLSESENPQDSVSMFIEMRRKMFNLDSFSFAFVLKGAANLRSFLGGIQLHCQALVFGFNTHVFVGTTLVSLYGECGCVEYAHKVFDEMSQRSIVSWNAMLTACFRCGNVERGKRVFDEMPFWDLTSWNVMLAGYIRVGTVQLARELFSKMPVKDDVSWSTMISGFAQNGCFDEAFGFFRDLRLAGVNLNEVSLTGVLSACAQAGAFEFGKILHGFVEKSGFGWMVSVNNALLETYAKCGNVGMARLVFERIPGKKSIVSWTSMIGGLAMLGYGEEAIQLFHQMEESGITPDEITFISLLYACSHTGLVEKGSDYFNKMIKFYGIKPTIEHYGCMVDIYGRAGLLQRAYEFINRMPMAPTAIIWRTLLGACSIHGNIELAEEVQKRVFELDPNDSSDHILLWNVYAVAGKWKDAAIVRRSMSSQGIIKQPGWSMIEVDRNMYKFVAGGDQSEITKQASEKLSEIISRLRVEGGYFPETRVVLYDLEEEEKQVAVTMHSEKLAVAFGMMRSCEGKIIRIVKNLRICRDCHTVMKLISKVYRFEIVVRDRSRFHSIKDGSCTCRDFW